MSSPADSTGSQPQVNTMEYPEEMQPPSSRSFWLSQDAVANAFDSIEASNTPPIQSCPTFPSPFVSPTCHDSQVSSRNSRCHQDLNCPSNTQSLEIDSESIAGASFSTLSNHHLSMNPLHMSWASAPLHCNAMASDPRQLLELPYSTHQNLESNSESALPADERGFHPLIAHDTGLPDPRQFQAPASYQAFLQPFMRRPMNSGLQLATKSNTKASWHCSTVTHTMSGKGPLDSPCRVISGFTKVLQDDADPPFSGDLNNVENISSATFAADDEQHKVAQDQTLNVPGGHTAKSPPSMSRTHQEAGPSQIAARPKRKRVRTLKHGDEVESQRMTHIAVERNRRKQMNEHLAALRSLMPGSYVQKGDQASIVGGAIEFLKELEHLLHFLQVQKQRRTYSELTNATAPGSRATILCAQSEVGPQGLHIPKQPALSFQGPLHKQRALLPGVPAAAITSHIEQSRHLPAHNKYPTQNHAGFYTSQQHHHQQQQAAAAAAMRVLMEGNNDVQQEVGEAKSEVASVEVRRVVGTEAGVVKIMSRRRWGQLVRTVVTLESLSLTVLHTNITTIHHTVLYAFHVTIGAKCKLTMEELAIALHQTFGSMYHSLQF